ncbi:MAG: helix-hairpin-helix domain-containing protein [Bacteroidota bacterium]
MFKIPEQIKDFLYFTKGERNGISLLLVLILLVILSSFIYQYFLPETTSDYSNFQKEIAIFENSLQKSKKETSINQLGKYIENKYDTLDLFYFDPNTTSDESFKKLGLTDKQITTINNYQGKGGRFYVKDDFQKIYGIAYSQYMKLKPFILLADKINDKAQTYQKYAKNNSTLPDSLFHFDPNTTTEDEWTGLGLKEKQIKIIKNYLNKGGVFYKKEDLKKIYGISNATYTKLEPYIKIEKIKPSLIEEKVIYVELNSATYQELIQINGIGDYLANGIIRYRKKLGGFIKKGQLLEIKNFPKNTFQRIYAHLTVDTKKIKRLNLNFSEVKEFVTHPYLNYHQSKAIVQYRTDNGPYQSIDKLVDKKIIPQSTFNKLKPYLVVN